MTGSPTFMAVSKFRFMTPQVPPCPAQRCIIITLHRGIMRSMTAALAPMFWALAWQAW